MGPDGVGDGQEIGPRAHQRLGIVEIDAADRHARRQRCLLPDFEDFGVGPMLRRFGFRRVKRAEGDIVRARFRGFVGEIARVVAGDADNSVGPEQTSRLCVARVALADMDAVGVERAARSGRSLTMKAEAAVCTMVFRALPAARMSASAVSFMRS